VAITVEASRTLAVGNENVSLELGEFVVLTAYLALKCPVLETMLLLLTVVCVALLLNVSARAADAADE
jgi:hypothetical protein